jgi:hypothetical protein
MRPATLMRRTREPGKLPLTGVQHRSPPDVGSQACKVRVLTMAKSRRRARRKPAGRALFLALMILIVFAILFYVTI